MSEPSREEIAKAVKAELDEMIFPVYRTEDDRGLDEDEYVDFVAAILARLAAKPERERDIARLIETIEGFYKFDCEAGPLKSCGEWIALKRALKGDPA